MIILDKKAISRDLSVRGEDLLNAAINKLPLELHLPGYQYCGPGTNLKKRLARGDPGVNALDEACKNHDIAYSKHKSISDRHIADKILAAKAWQRVQSKDSSITEKASAYMVTNIMKGKVKLGMGVLRKPVRRSKSIKRKIKKLMSFNKTIRNVGKILKAKKPQNIDEAIKIALSAAKKTFKKNTNIKTPRVISIPENGSALPFLVPLFASFQLG